MTYRTLADGQRAQVFLGGPGISNPELVFETSEMLIEAPNWSLDGRALYLNGHGGLWRLDLGTPSRELPGKSHSELVRIDFDGLPELNNDHVLDPDGEHIYASAMDGHIYRGALAGGPVQRVTTDEGVWHFLHGVAPDGQRLAYVRISDFAEPGRLAIVTPGGPSTVIDVGPGHLDGPEWSPDGRWIYLNTESFTQTRGHAQLARIPDGSDRGFGPAERLVASDTVDWFPHVSPDGQWASYIAFPAGTQGHPADLDVQVRVVATSDWSVPVQRYPLFGGQGTINVNSWSPDSTRFAFVAYPNEALANAAAS